MYSIRTTRNNKGTIVKYFFTILVVLIEYHKDDIIIMYIIKSSRHIDLSRALSPHSFISFV